MPLYRFEIDQGNSERTVLDYLAAPPSEGDAPWVGGMTGLVTRFTPVPDDQQEAAGHAGIVECVPAVLRITGSSSKKP
jgi:hypothetical protein